MLELGAIAVIDGEVTDRTFSEFLQPIEGATPDPLTMAWWRSQPYETTARQFSGIVERKPADVVIADFAQWLEQFKNPVAAAWPAVFDFAFVNYYAHKFLHQNPLGYSCLDIRSYVAGLVNATDYATPREHEIYDLAGGTRDGERVAHAALDDAIGQARVLAGAIAYARNTKREGN